MHYWLMKSEPDVFSIGDLKAAKRAPWDGVRNYQARNNIEQMHAGDLFLFYHSSCKPPGLAGVGEIVSEPYPDRAALDPSSPYHDPKATAEKLPWKAVDVCFREAFDQLLSLETIRTLPGLEGLALLKKASRLSVMPVTAEQWEILVGAARSAALGA
ncbi:EVE domain-containing protein [Pseudomonas saliphila]|uniref:EVE domain-containing protein n=1 Tax=Pseudomonas saliphila TaxID=2586906 RepID=UPI00123A69CC|nr:EVE domain-containing protein [Pseudomonas saliphila]